jgi:anti-sigma-K factor RskA
MTQFSREELLGLAAAYALGATTPDETAAIEAALPTSPELAAEVAAYRDVTVKLAQQHPASPSPSVRSAFLSGIAQNKSATLAPSRARSRAVAWLSVALAASVVYAVQLQLQYAGLERELVQRGAELAVAQSEAARRNGQLNALLAADRDLYLVHLKTNDTLNGPGIQFFWNEKQHRALAHAFRLKPAPAGRAYQVWLLVKGKPVGVSVFNSEPDGSAIIENFTLPDSVAGVTDVLVTEEPAGGSPQPTTTPFIGGKLLAH